MYILHLLLMYILLADSLPHNPALHFPLHRRGGRFAYHQPANLSQLLQISRTVVDKFHRTYRSVENNHLVRRWKQDHVDHAMLDEAGLKDGWYTTVQIGNPPQELELDLDFMSSDFFTLLTTSRGGSKFNTFASQSHDSGSTFVNPLCRLSSDGFHISNLHGAVRLEWPICQPSKASRHTLSNSGTILGLAPNFQSRSSLARLTAPSFIENIFQQGFVSSPVWSIALLDSTTGILSLGGTLAAEFEDARTRAEAELKYLGQEDAVLQVEKEVAAKMAFAMPDGSTYEDHFKWIDVSGATGWWTGLMSGVWVDGAKILKNQPFLIDLSCPFLIAPPTAFKHLFRSISGSKPLPPASLSSTYSASSNSSTSSFTPNMTETFHLFPCLNPPSVSFELAGWPFPLADPSRSTREDAFHGPAGGAFSLGKVEEFFHTRAKLNSTVDQQQGNINGVNSGFCVGIVVGSDMGERPEAQWKDSGMRDVWVLGEPFFRGLGIVFDDGHGTGKARIGFRRY